jgi:hypothetical protein
MGTARHGSATTNRFASAWNLDPPPPLRTQRLDASPSAAVDRQQRPQHRLEQTRGRQSNNTQSSNNTSYNLDYYYNADVSLRQLVHGASPTTASISTTSPLATAPQLPVQPHTPSIDTWSVQLQRQITTLQQFVTTLAQEQRLVQHPPHLAASSSSVTSAAVVPPSVWEALADLQRLQHEMQKAGR